jgi:hypothetical protein
MSEKRELKEKDLVTYTGLVLRREREREREVVVVGFFYERSKNCLLWRRNFCFFFVLQQLK